MSDETGNQRGRRIAQTVSHYRIVEELGTGVMGTVYKAEDTRLGRIVALKFYENEACCSEEGRRRILEEARLAAAVSCSWISEKRDGSAPARSPAWAR